MFGLLQAKLHERVQRLMGERGLSIRAVLMCFAVLVMFNACPDNPFRPLNLSHAADDDLSNYARKLSDPFVDLATSPTDTSHASKLNYRLAVPVLCKPFGLDLKALRWVGIGLALGSIALLLSFFERLTKDRAASFWWTLVFCALPASGRLFFDLHPFDRFAIFFGVAALACAHPLAVGFAVFAGAWTDERCLVASFWVVILHGALWLRGGGPRARQCVAAILMAWVGYGVTRWLVWKSVGMTVAMGGVHTRLFVPHLGNLPVATFLAMETAWFAMLAILLGLVVEQRSRLLAVALLVAMLGGVLSCACVIDMTRSLNHFWVALPAILAVGIWRNPEVWTAERLRFMGLSVAITCLVLPSTECYLLGSPNTSDGTGGRLVLLGMLKPLPVRLVAWLLGIQQG